MCRDSISPEDFLFIYIDDKHFDDKHFDENILMVIQRMVGEDRLHMSQNKRVFRECQLRSEAVISCV